MLKTILLAVSVITAQGFGVQSERRIASVWAMEMYDAADGEQNENEVWCTSWSGACCKNGNHKFGTKDNACASGKSSGKVKKIYDNCEWQDDGAYCCDKKNSAKSC